MAGFSDTVENQLANFFFRGVAFTPPATFYLALFTAAPGENSAGTEVTGGGYARQPITQAQFSAPGAVGTATAGVVSNSQLVVFPVATAAYTVVSWCLMSAATGGTIQTLMDFPAQGVAIAINEQFTVQPGAASFAFN